MARSLRPRTLRILEHKRAVKADSLHQGQRLPVILIRLAAEPGNDVRRNDAVRKDLPDLIDPCQILLPGIFAIHLLQHRGTAGLDRKMDMLADIVVHRHHIEHVVAHIFGMRSRKTDAHRGVEQSHLLQQLREIDRTGRIGGIRPEVRIHVLAEQGDLPVSGGNQFTGFTQDAVRIAAALGATDIRHDAIRADIVAAAHDGDKCRHSGRIRADRGDVGVGLLVGKQRIDLLFAVADTGYQPRQVAVRIRSGYDIHRFILQKGSLEPFGHASEHADDDAPLLFLLAENIQAAKDALFGIVPYRTGIDQDQVCIADAVAQRPSVILQDGQDDLAVVDIHLASVGFDEYLRARKVRYGSEIGSCCLCHYPVSMITQR